MKACILRVGIAIAALCGCGSGNDDKGTGGSTSAVGGQSGASGSNGGHGGTGAGGSGSSGSSGSSAGGATPTGAHCTPGTAKPVESLIGLELGSCPSVSGLTGELGFGSIFDIQLTTPIGPGQAFAFSIEVTTPEGDFEIYGATRRCGDVGELLSKVHFGGDGIICHDVTPVTGTYSHLIWVRRPSAILKAATICESGMCPRP
jgi:hypothetical protein